MKILSKLKAKVPSWLWAGATSGLAASAATLAVVALGVLGNIAEWASSQGQNPFPDLSVLGYASVSAVVGVVTAVANAGYRFIQSRSKLIPGTGPVYPQAPDA